MKHRYLVLACGLLAALAGPAAVARAATLTPNTVLDETTSGNGQCSLPEAISATRSVGTPGDCGTASGTDTIVLGAATTSAPASASPVARLLPGRRGRGAAA